MKKTKFFLLMITRAVIGEDEEKREVRVEGELVTLECEWNVDEMKNDILEISYHK